MLAKILAYSSKDSAINPVLLLSKKNYFNNQNNIFGLSRNILPSKFPQEYSKNIINITKKCMYGMFPGIF